jgi:hypothetical protein
MHWLTVQSDQLIRRYIVVVVVEKERERTNKAQETNQGTCEYTSVVRARGIIREVTRTFESWGRKEWKSWGMGVVQRRLDGKERKRRRRGSSS